MKRDALIDRARAGFEASFGRGGEVTAWAPGRVNLIGEHTDYNGGLALPMAIDLGCVCVMGRGNGRHDRFAALDLDARWDGEGRAPGWARYALGVLALTRGATGEPDPVDVVVTSSVPMGSGMSSSAALEVSVATAAEGLGQTRLEPLELARLCQRAEHEFAGVPCGLMDQLVSVAGRAGEALLVDFSDNSWTRYPAPAQGTVLVIDSGVRHALAEGEYAKRRASCERACSLLGVASLGGLSTSVAEDERLDDELRARVRHVTSEIERTRAGASALRDGRLDELGRLMSASHVSLRDDYKVSFAEVDAIVEAAQSVPGVFGARMMGGGFGGSAIVLGEVEAIARLAQGDLGTQRWVVRASEGAAVI